MEQTVMMADEETPEVGPNDIVIHLVNPYKCGMCELEFLEKAVFKEHIFTHLEQIKQERPSSQIVVTVSLPPETPGGVTVTRDILQLGEDGSIKQVLQPTNLTLNQVSPLRELEEAGVIKLDPPKAKDASVPGIPVLKPSVPKVRGVAPLVSDIPTEDAGLGVMGVLDATGSGIEAFVKEETEGLEGDVSEILENKDGSYSLAVKGGPFDEVQHIQILRPDGTKGDMMLELTNIHNRRRGTRVAHRSNECDICGKVLSSSTNLIRHKMYHSSARPFVCDVCGKGFKDVSNLKKHTMIHKRIYPCYLCKKSFLRKSLLALHLKRHQERTCVVKSGNSSKEVTMRTFLEKDGTRVEEMSMTALAGATFEYKNRIVKADPDDVRNSQKSKEKDLKPENVNAATCTTDAADMADVADASSVEAVKNSDERDESQKPMFTVTYEGLQEASLEEEQKEENSKTLTADENDVEEDEESITVPDVAQDFVKVYQCGHCGKRTVQRGNMMRHLIHHLKEKPYKCDVCPKQFVDKGELVKHKKTHTKPYRCHQCNGAFAHNVQLVKHLQTECLGNSEQLNYSVLADGKTYKCDVCRIEMKRLGNMIKHVGTHSISIRRAAVKKIPSHLPKKTMESKSSGGEDFQPSASYYYDAQQKIFICNFCSKRFNQKANVHRHIRVHTKERPYQCTDCDRWFPCATTLKRHALVHLKPFKCDRCSAVFSRKLFLETHKRRHDEKERDEDTADYGVLKDKSGYYCKHCNKELFKKYRMMSHVRQHVSKRPFECPDCNKCFSCKYMMLKHRKAAHAKPFPCDQCGQTFTRQFFLLNHKKKMHGDSEYTDLNYEYSQFKAVGSQLQPRRSGNDSLKESEEKMYYCSICEAPFNRLVIQLNHERKCQQESKVMTRLPDGKGYQCKLCGKIATLKHNLMVHIRKNHSVSISDLSGDIVVHEEGKGSLGNTASDLADDEKPSDVEKTKEKKISSAKKSNSDISESELVDDDDDDVDDAFVLKEENDAEEEEEEDPRIARTPGGYACLACRQKFKDRATLMPHLETHKSEETKLSVTETKKKRETGGGVNPSRQGQTDSFAPSELEHQAKKVLATSAKRTSIGRGKARAGSSPKSTPSPSRSPRSVHSFLASKHAGGQGLEEESTSPRSMSRPARTQKIPSRFLE